jgi:hypothetical protein
MSTQKGKFGTPLVPLNALNILCDIFLKMYRGFSIFRFLVFNSGVAEACVLGYDTAMVGNQSLTL